MDNPGELNGRRTPTRNGTRDDLETRLREGPTLSTDILDVLAIIGWSKYGGPAYEQAGEELRKRLSNQYEVRQKRLSRKSRTRETRFAHALEYAHYREGCKTLGEFKKIIEEEGLTFQGMGYLGLARFNKILRNYGIEPIKIGGTGVTDRYLKRYWLKSSRS